MKKIAPPSLKIDRKFLGAMAIADLSRLSESLQTISDVTNGLMAKPCFFNEEERMFTDGGEVLENICTFVDHLRVAVVEAACNATPESDDDKRQMIWARLKYEAELGDDLSAFNLMVMQLTATLPQKKIGATDTR